MAKQYGLIIPKSKGHQIGQVTSRPSIFNDDSDSDTPDTKPTGISRTIKKQDKMNQDKAVNEDPTVFQYDEIFDEMDQKRKESKLARKDLERKPKYISKLLAAADKRKRENERRIERQVQKEREEEGDMYQDKESFVTSAYKKKLEELKELEEQEKREEYLESIGDVRKQGNLDGFYRHLYDQKLNYEEKEETEENPSVKTEVKEEPESDTEEVAENSPVADENITKKSKEGARKRKYRSHRLSDEDNNSEGEPEVKKEHLPSNLDADSDFSIDSSESEEEKEKEEKPAEKPGEKTQTEPIPVEAETIEEKKELDEDNKDKATELIEVKPSKPKIDIWKKRTVGEKFDEAVQRYFERKALREMGQ